MSDLSEAKKEKLYWELKISLMFSVTGFWAKDLIRPRVLNDKLYLGSLVPLLSLETIMKNTHTNDQNLL